MQTIFEPAMLAQSVISVPPLARDEAGGISAAENAKLIEHLSAGGVSTFLYGGNANVYHLGRDDYADMLGLIADAAPDGALMIPSAGPDYGKLLDHAADLERSRFPLAMVLPSSAPSTPIGAERAVRDFADRFGRQVMLYLKTEFFDVAAVGRMVADGAVHAIKYAIPRTNPADDSYLDGLLGQVPKDLIISGFGEMPAVEHMRRFLLPGYTAGCVCVAPRLSTAMLAACLRRDWDEAERIRVLFAPLEALRERIDAITVLHYAVRWAGIADMGDIHPSLSAPAPEHRDEIVAATRDLIDAEQSFFTSG